MANLGFYSDYTPEDTLALDDFGQTDPPLGISTNDNDSSDNKYGGDLSKVLERWEEEESPNETLSPSPSRHTSTTDARLLAQLWGPPPDSSSSSSSSGSNNSSIGPLEAISGLNIGGGDDDDDDDKEGGGRGREHGVREDEEEEGGSGHPLRGTNGRQALFDDDDEEGSNGLDGFTPASSSASSIMAQDQGMQYPEFICRFMQSKDLVDQARRFLFSVLGPTGDAVTPPDKRDKVDYIFYGKYKLKERCMAFFEEMQSKFQDHVEWEFESEERQLAVRDCLEQYVMTRIGDVAYSTVLDQVCDDRTLARMQLLSFLEPRHLDIQENKFDATLLAIASSELRKINTYKTPGDKVACVVKSASIIFKLLNLIRAKREAEVESHNNNNNNNSSSSSSDSNSEPEQQKEKEVRGAMGADDFFPLFIWAVLKCHIPNLYSTCEYVQSYLNPARLMSKWGYCLINLRSAVEFVNYLDAEVVCGMNQEEFESALARSEEELKHSDGNNKYKE